MPALLLLTGPKAGHRYEVAAEVTLGRSPSCEIALDDEKVSRKHARIELRGGETWLSDLGSKNGTLLNGAVVGQKVTLRAGDQVQVGETTILFEATVEAGLSEHALANIQTVPVEELLPLAGTEGALFTAASALISAASEAAVFRRAADELLRGAAADGSVALRMEGASWTPAAVAGVAALEVPRALAEACALRREVAHEGGHLAVPVLASAGAPVGILYAVRAAPFGAQELRLAAAVARLSGERLASMGGSEPSAPPVPVGASAQHLRLVEACGAAAGHDAPVALYGPPGSGRTFFARYIHARSRRRRGPWVSVDCAADDAEQALFGRGGTSQAPPMLSALARADGGTLLCESLDALPPELGAKLLRLLAAQRAPRPGGGDDAVDVRAIATLAAAPSGELAAFFGAQALEVPGLDARPADVPSLFEAFLRKFAARSGRVAPVISPEAATALASLRFAANARSLEQLAERVIASGVGAVLNADALPVELQATGESLHQRVARVERDAIAAALREAAGRKIRAAAILGISRPTLDKKIAEYGLKVEKT